MTPSGKTATATRLAELLHSGTAIAEELAASLDAERAALEEPDASELDTATAKKESCLQRFQSFEGDRRDLLRGTEFSDDLDGMAALMSWCDADDVLVDRWHSYLDRARDCQQSNMTNGAIIRLRLQQNAGALAVLSGTTPATYDGSGSSQHHTASRRLAEA